MERLTDFDEYMNAMKKIRLDESVFPVVRGSIVVEDEETYNKIQKLLNSDEMEASHKFLYNLDSEDLSEDEVEKVNNLYKLAVDRGIIKDPNAKPDDDEDDTEDSDEDSDDDTEAKDTKKKKKDVDSEEDEADEDADKSESEWDGGIIDYSNTFDSMPKREQFKNPTYSIKSKIPTYTVLYSATRNGNIRTGEVDSYANSPRAAKMDAIAKLIKCGYQHITILTIEAGDPDSAGMGDEEDYACDDCEDDSIDMMEEADDREVVSHLMDPIGIKTSSANLVRRNCVRMDAIEEDDDDDVMDEDEEEAEKEEEKQENKKADKAPANDDTEDTEDDPEDDDEDDVEAEPEDTDDDTEDVEDEPEDEGDDTDDELSPSDKENYKTQYKNAFKTALKKQGVITLNDLDLDGKIKFFTELARLWKGKPDSNKFMTDAEQKKLEAIKLK